MGTKEYKKLIIGRKKWMMNYVKNIYKEETSGEMEGEDSLWSKEQCEWLKEYIESNFDELLTEIGQIK
jgi:hypothetical protein